MEKNEYQVAGVNLGTFVSEMLPYLEKGYLPDIESATHLWPSTFVVTMKKAQVKQQEPVDNKPVRQQRQQKAVDKQD